ncbi:MAG: ribbon-helix-helix protein, CopG family [Tepidiformaceae bacterium]
MAIRTAEKRGRKAQGQTRTTLSLPTDLLAKIDAEVGDGRAPSRNDFVRYAIAMELWRREQAAIDAAYAEVLADPEYIAEAEQIMKEFEAADAETARMIDDEFGPWEEPLD